MFLYLEESWTFMRYDYGSKLDITTYAKELLQSHNRYRYVLNCCCLAYPLPFKSGSN
jgi:hypothetical protein